MIISIQISIQMLCFQIFNLFLSEEGHVVLTAQKNRQKTDGDEELDHLLLCLVSLITCVLKKSTEEYLGLEHHPHEGAFAVP